MKEIKHDGIKISSLELENVKRVKAVALKPTQSGLTVIGGRNGQGKTSVLDGIAYALGGERMRPDKPKRDGSATDPMMRVELSNGIVVERRGKNSSLKVTDSTGKKAGQSLLNSFIEELALNLPKFLDKSDKEKADELLKIIGVGDELNRIDRAIEAKMEERKAIGQQKRAKRKVAEDAPWFPDAPEQPVSAVELLEEQRAILDANARNAAVRQRRASLAGNLARIEQEHERLAQQIAALISQQEENVKTREGVARAMELLDEEIPTLVDGDESDIGRRIAEVDEVNEKVRANQRRAEMLAEADALDEEWTAMTAELDAMKDERIKLLDGADMPLDGLGVEDGRLVYNGATWGDMSGSEQLRVATAIVRKLKPECGFALVDKLEQMDAQTLADFGEWAAGEGLQVIGTRVATDESCTIVIEDGRAVQEEQPEQVEHADRLADKSERSEPAKKVTAFKEVKEGVF